jgi:hypothetical protein
MPIPLESIGNYQELESTVSGPGRATRQIIATGTAAFSFRGDGSGGYRGETLSFPVGPTLRQTQFVRAVASAGLASIGLDAPGPAGWAINGVEAGYDATARKAVVRVHLAVRGPDAWLLRVNFQVTILATR